MPIQQRIQLYTELETLRQRPLIVYVTSFRQKATGLMAADAIPELLDQLGKVPLENRGIDLLLVSHGGDATVAWRAISLLRERFSSVAVLVPQAAFSAATLLALGADEIVMHPHANLGPVDPQMTVAKVIPGASGPVEVRFGYEDLLGFLEFARTEAKLTNEVHIKELLQQFCAEVGTIAVGLAARGSLLSITMGEKLLQMHMKDRKVRKKARAIAESLNKNYFNHGYPVSRTEAKEIGLKVAASNPEVEGLMWKIWLDIEAELKIRSPFDPLTEVLASPASAALLAQSTQINLPNNLPAPILQGVIQNILQQLNVSIQPINPVDFEIIRALMESKRIASHCLQKGKILALRSPELEIKLTQITIKNGWSEVAIPAP